MRKYFLILVLLFFAPAVHAQVTIDNPTAQFFLEQNEKVKILTEQQFTLKADIGALKEQLHVAEQIGATRVADVESYKGKIAEKEVQLNLVKGEIKRLEKEIRRLKFKAILAYVFGGVAVLIALIYG